MHKHSDTRVTARTVQCLLKHVVYATHNASLSLPSPAVPRPFRSRGRALWLRVFLSQRAEGANVLPADCGRVPGTGAT